MALFAGSELASVANPRKFLDSGCIHFTLTPRGRCRPGPTRPPRCLLAYLARQTFIEMTALVGSVHHDDILWFRLLRRQVLYLRPADTTSAISRPSSKAIRRARRSPASSSISDPMLSSHLCRITQRRRSLFHVGSQLEPGSMEACDICITQIPKGSSRLSTWPRLSLISTAMPRNFIRRIFSISMTGRLPCWRSA